MHFLSVKLAKSVFIECAALELVLEKAESVARAVEVHEEGEVEAKEEAEEERLWVDS